MDLSSRFEERNFLRLAHSKPEPETKFDNENKAFDNAKTSRTTQARSKSLKTNG